MSTIRNAWVAYSIGVIISKRTVRQADGPPKSIEELSRVKSVFSVGEGVRMGIEHYASVVEST